MRPLFQLQNVKKDYAKVKVLKDLTLTLYKGETFSLVGESGSGKSTTAKLILALEKPTAGRILYQAENLNTFSKKKLKALRRKVQIVFQDPFSSLDPRMTIEQIVREPLDIHKVYTKKNRKKKVAELLSLVGLSPNIMHRYPHTFSGGERQRINIARALATSPSVLILDEPLSSLDVSIQAQIVELLQNLKKKLKLTLFFISHDLARVKQLSDRVGVMFQGELVELAPKEKLFENPEHPYTQKLLASAPKIPYVKKSEFARI